MPDPFNESTANMPVRVAAEAVRAAQAYLAAQRTLMWTVAIIIPLWPVARFGPPRLAHIALLIVCYLVTRLALARGALSSTAEWLHSLNRIAGYPPIPDGVSMARHVRSVLAQHALMKDILG